MPNFPGKKPFGNMAEAFLNERQVALENYFKYFLASPEIQKSQQLLNYFLEKSADANSNAKVKELIEYIKKGKLPAN